MTPRRYLIRNLQYLLISTSLVITLTLFYHVHPLSSRRSMKTEPIKLPLELDLPSHAQEMQKDDHPFERHVLPDTEPEPQEIPPPPPEINDKVSLSGKKQDKLEKLEATTTIDGWIEETPLDGNDLEEEEEEDDDPDIFTMDQSDPRLIQYIRQHHLTPPSRLSYANMTQYGGHANWYSSYIHSLFSKTKGHKVFIEAGAYDGEIASNSLYLEEDGWTGLLVECNPLLLPKLMAKNRKAWIANVCLSPTNTPKMMNFTTLTEWPASAKLGRPLNEEEMNKHGLDWVTNKTWTNYKIPCFPLFSIIKAIGDVTEIDFLSLDVEGAEIDILKHFPFEKMRIKTMIVEVHTFSDKDKADLRGYLGNKGFQLRKKVENDDVYVLANSKL